MTPDQPWFLNPFFALDTETTGVNTAEDRIVTLTISPFDQRQGEGARTWLINPGIEIPEAATSVHGITTQHAIDHGQDPREALAEILGILQKCHHQSWPVCVFNAPFDLSLLAAEAARHNLPEPNYAGVIDPMVMDKHIDPYRRGSRKLVDVAAHYGIQVPAGQQTHTSETDTWLAGHTALAMAHGAVELQVPITALTVRQANWAREQKASFAAYLRRQGRAAEADTVTSEWPLR